MRSQAHVALQQQYHQHHQHHQHHHQTSPHYSSSPMLPGLSELGLVVGAQGGNDRSPPSARGNTLHSFSPQSPPRPQQSSKKEPWYERSSVAIPMVESLPYQQPMNKLVASQNGGASVGPNRYQRQQQPQQQQQNQYQSHVGGGNYPNPSLSPLVKQPSSPLQQHDQVQHRHPVAVQWWNNEDGPWSPVSTRNQVSASNHRDSTDGPRGLKRSSAAGSASSPGRKDSSGPPPAGNGIINENSHAESRRRASAGTVSAPEFHERSASCPSLLQHIGMPVAQCPGDLQTPSRSTAAGGAQNSQYHNLPGMEHDPVPGGLTPSPQTNVRFPPPASANQRSVDGCNTYNHSNGVRSNSTGDVLAWMSSPRSDSKSTTSGHTMGTNQPLPETGDSDTIPSELLTPTSRIWKGHPNSSSPPYGINNHINDNDSNSNMRNMGTSLENRARQSIGLTLGEDYEYVQQSPTPGASMASSTTSSETTTTRISDGGSVPKRRSISAAKREYRCTKKEGCDAVFTCNSLRKKHEMKHTKPFTCLQRSCPKHKVGFTTSNDLRRHMKALHGYRYKSSVSNSRANLGGDGSVDGSVDPEVIAAVDAVGGWRCKYCPTVEPSNGIGHGHPAKGFFSTRKDNFRNHIKRIHSSLRRENETMDEFFRRSELECRVDSPILMPTVLSPAGTQIMDTDMGTQETSTATTIGESYSGAGGTPGNVNVERRTHEDSKNLPAVDSWQGLPPPVTAAHGGQSMIGQDRQHKSPRDAMNFSGGGYDSAAPGGSSQTGRKAMASRSQHQQELEMESGRQPDRGAGAATSAGQHANRSYAGGGVVISNGVSAVRAAPGEHGVQPIATGVVHPGCSSSAGWTPVNSGTSRSRDGPHARAQAPARFADGNSLSHGHAGAQSPGRLAAGGAPGPTVGRALEELEQEEQKVLQTLERIRAQKRKLLDRVQKHPPAARSAQQSEGSDVEMDLDGCGASTQPPWFAFARPQNSKPISAGAMLLSQILNDVDEHSPIGLKPPSTNPGPPTAKEEAVAPAHDLFLSPKPASPPPSWFSAPAAPASPRIKSIPSPSSRAQDVVPHFRRSQTWYPSRSKPVTPSTKDVSGKDKVYKAFCPHCQSSFRLPCQLRKHLKRHSKPFGCTHDGCNKVFGAKNDWKRHENSQHHQLECWKCDIRKYDVQSSPSALGADAADICGKCFFRKADFVKHLKVVHGNTDGWVVEQTTPAGAGTTAAETSQPVATTLTGARDVAQILFDCHIPKYHGGAFWCGFCHKVVKLHGKVGIEGWDKRFDHIAWHFEKDNLRVKDSWMRLEEPDPEGKGLGGSEGVCARDPGEESSGDEESTGYVDYIDSSPKRRQTEPGALSSFAIEQQLKSAPEGSMEDKLQSQAEWYCCRCNFGPFSYKHYVSCPNCKIPRCEKCPNEKKH